MKRVLVAVLFSVLTFTIANGQSTCPDNLADCLPEGCSPDNHHDPELNVLKNVPSSNKPIVDRTLTEIIALEGKAINKGYKKGKARTVLTNLGEGTQVRAVGYLLAVKKEGGESCNCGLSDTDVTTDNHLVLVNPKTLKDLPLPANAKKKTLTAIFHQREKESVTAEFTPRVRQNGHPNFTSELQKRLNKTPQGAIWVRVTGQLMMDSQHFRSKTPIRATSWEIHPIFKFELCPQGKTCSKTGDANWLDLDSLP